MSLELQLKIKFPHWKDGSGFRLKALSRPGVDVGPELCLDSLHKPQGVP